MYIVQLVCSNIGHIISPQNSYLFFGSAGLANYPKRSAAHFCWPHSAVSYHIMQITISSQSDKHTSQYPACNYWKYCLALWSWASSEEDVEIYWSVTRYHLKGLMPSPWEQHRLTQGLRGHLVKTITSKEDQVLLRIMVELVVRTGHFAFVHMVHGRLVAAGYRSRHLDWCLILTR